MLLFPARHILFFRFFFTEKFVKIYTVEVGLYSRWGRSWSQNKFFLKLELALKQNKVGFATPIFNSVAEPHPVDVAPGI